MNMAIPFGIEETCVSEVVCGMGVNQKHLPPGKKSKDNGLNKEHLSKRQVSMIDVKS